MGSYFVAFCMWINNQTFHNPFHSLNDRSLLTGFANMTMKLTICSELCNVIIERNISHNATFIYISNLTNIRCRGLHCITSNRISFEVNIDLLNLPTTSRLRGSQQSSRPNCITTTRETPQPQNDLLSVILDGITNLLQFLNLLIWNR